MAMHAAVCASSFPHCPGGAEESAHGETQHGLGSPPLSYTDVVFRPGLPCVVTALGTTPTVPGEGHDTAPVSCPLVAYGLAPECELLLSRAVVPPNSENDLERYSRVHQVSVVIEMLCVHILVCLDLTFTTALLVCSAEWSVMFTHTHIK